MSLLRLPYQGSFCTPCQVPYRRCYKTVHCTVHIQGSCWDLRTTLHRLYSDRLQMHYRFRYLLLNKAEATFRLLQLQYF